MPGFQEVLTVDELPPGGQQTVQVGATRVLVCREADTGTIWALQDECPHAFQPLAGGRIRGGTIQCPKHGARFDLRTGEPLNAISPRSIHVYAVRIDGDSVLVSQTPVNA
jgi:nitrite reductase/ring-hydroxylating ferredoxin subunit